MGASTRKDLNKSWSTADVEISGKTDRNTAESIKRYPITAETESFLDRLSQKRKSAILGREGREMEWPSDVHHLR